MSMRKDDQDERTYFRTERFSLANSAWYFQTREHSLGPFSNRALAEKALQGYLEELSALKNFEGARRLARIIRIADSRNKAKQTAVEPLIEVVEEYRLEDLSEQTTPVLNSPGNHTSEIPNRLILVPQER